MVMEDKYYFSICSDKRHYSIWSTDNKRCLSWFIGDTLTSMITDKEQPLELIRMAYHDITIVVRRRPENIKLEIYERSE